MSVCAGDDFLVICPLKSFMMIQRIQTLFLLVALMLSIALFFVPLYSNEILNADNGTHDCQYTGITSNTVYLVFNCLTALLTLVIILLYKNRIAQVRLCNLNLFITCIFIGTIFYFADRSNSAL